MVSDIQTHFETKKVIYRETLHQLNIQTQNTANRNGKQVAHNTVE